MTIETHDEVCPFCRGLHWHKYEYLEEKMILETDSLAF